MGLWAFVLGPPIGEALPDVSTIEFSSLVEVTSALDSAAEPNIAIDPDGRIYVATLGPHARVWRSDDGGRTFQRVADGLGNGGDVDIALDADGTLYTTDLQSLVPLSVSFDHGASYNFSRTISPPGQTDRQWIQATGSGRLHVTWLWKSPEPSQPTQLKFARSSDGGRSLDIADLSILPFGVKRAGPVQLGPAGLLFVPVWTGNDMILMRSADGGASWIRSNVAPNRGTVNTIIFPVAASDSAGNIYVAWSESAALPGGIASSADTRLFLAVSLDEGQNFGAPRILSDANHRAIFPWVLAGHPGRIDVFWYDGVPGVAPLPGEPDVAEGYAWYVAMAQSLDADQANAAFERVLVNSEPIHHGSVCTRGANACTVGVPSVASDRRLLDFFEATLDADGQALVTFAKDPLLAGDVVGHANGRASTVQFAGQVAGPRLFVTP